VPFNSPEFLFVFLPLVVLACALARLKPRMVSVQTVLLVASLTYYAWWDSSYLPLLLLTIAGNFMLATITWSRPALRRWCLTAGVILNIGLLAHYKYTGFVIGDVLGFSGIADKIVPTHLPPAISFFSFQQLAWLFNATRPGAIRMSLPVYALFVSLFPKLMAGPIVDNSVLAPQLMSPRLGFVSPQTIAAAISLFAIGLFKKVVVADSFAPTADAAFRSALDHHVMFSAQAWTGVASYTCQIYFDFSGYSDMAVGLALLFGVVLPINFASPYKAKDVIEFWRRWHITLSHFLRDFIYIPLGGNRVRPWRQITNLIVTMVVGGLWHGAGYTFVAWGLLHGILLAVVHVHRRLAATAQGFWSKAGPISLPLTLVTIMMTWVPFRADSLEAAGSMYLNLYPPLRAMLRESGLITRLASQEPSYLPAIGRTATLAAVLGLIACATLPCTAQLFARYLGADAKGCERGPLVALLAWKPSPAWAVVTGAILFYAVADLFAASPTSFLYFRF
jgi:D-alanyl-lipoteichoic acid acyltransferase DltB (MBOAT superfamily)